MPLDYVNSIPLHIQLKEALEHKIFKGEYVNQIPSEREIMDEYYLSRSTVRQSISQLVQEGILEKRRGIGAFIAIKPIDDWLGNLKSTNETIENMGMDPGANLIQSEIIKPSEAFQTSTGLNQAYHFARIRYANQVPIGIERHYYPVNLGKQLIQYDLNQVSLYSVLEREIGVNTFEADQVIKSVQASAEDAELLNIPHPSSVLNAQRMITDIEGEFVEFENAYYRSDMYSFHIKLSRKSN